MKTWHYIISEKCNMKCTYCNVDVDNNIRLDKEFFLEFKKNIGNEPYIFSIFGGEPFLQLDIVKFIITELQNDPNLLKIIITTNCTIFNDDVQFVINHPKTQVTISYDGLKQLDHRGNNKLYIKEYIEQGASTGHCMITGEDFNILDTDYIINLHLSIRDVNLTPDITIVRDIGSWNQKQVDNFKQAFKEYVNYIKDNELNNILNFSELPGLIKNYLNSLFEFHIKHNVQKDCGCGTEHFAILPNQKILPCERFDRDNETLSKIPNRDNILNACNTCDIRDYCHKGCIYEQLKNNAVIPELCEIYKFIFKTLKILVKETGHKLLKLYTKENL